MSENFPKLMKETNPCIQEIEGTPSKTNTKTNHTKTHQTAEKKEKEKEIFKTFISHKRNINKCEITE